MSVDEYDPSTALTAYFQDRNTNRPARLWSVEKVLHDLAAIGFVTFFEGAGDNPTQITGYAIDQIWLRTSPLVTTEPGEFRAYAGSGDATLLASWPELDAAGVRRHLSIYSKAEIDAAFAAGLPPGFSSDDVGNDSGVSGATVSDALDTVAGSVTTLTASLAAEVAALESADDTLTSSVANATFPSGTRLLFQQTAAPTGWTKDTTHNDAALRIVSGPASSGGTKAFLDAFTSRTIAQANLPNVTLTVTGNVSSSTTISNGVNVLKGSVSGGAFSAAGTNGYATITATTTSTFSGGATASINGGVTQTGMDFAVKYVDATICVKD